MTLEVAATRVAVVTESRRFEGQATYGEGLSLVRADNNMGKTTLLMSILYAMGLEGMLGPGDQMPLKPAVLNEIRDEDGHKHVVLESWAMVELANDRGERLTLQRPIVSEAEKRNLVRTWAGPALSSPSGSYGAQDAYVRLGGAARNEAGLHRQLAEFIGWDLPEVTAWDGSSIPLYMELVFPLLFVEQTRGWSGIAAVMPRYLRARDPERRATEFLLGLGALTRARDRDSLVAQANDLKADWRGVVDGFRARVSELGGLLDNVAPDPPVDWPPAVAPAVRVLVDEEWVHLPDALRQLRTELDEASQEIPRVEEIADQVSAQLVEAEARLSRLAGLVAATARDTRDQQAEIDALDERLAAVAEDRSRYVDAIRLRDLGSVQNLAVVGSRCPTCEQNLPQTLLGGDLRPVMTLEDNKRLLDEERETFQAMRDDADTVAIATRRKLLGLRRALDDTRREVRSYKATLTQNAHAPSRAAIERQVRLVQRIDQLEALEEGLVALDEQLTPLAERNRQLRAALAGLGRGALSGEDQERLDALQQSVREQLHAYGFNSVPAEEIEIARDSYLPQRAGSPLAAKDISASDNVRLVWAYLIGLLEVARQFDTQHPGLLIFDEPGQQEISDASLEALLARLAATGPSGQQAIVATSKPRDQLDEMLAGRPLSFNEFDGHTLRVQ